MANIMDYLHWRGDLEFSQDPVNEVDALIFSTLSYIRFEGSLKEQFLTPISLQAAADEFFQLDNLEKRARGKNDIELLRLAASTKRFGNTKICMYRNEFNPHQDTQFAAETYLLDDGGAMIAFRGTDNTLVGWKEDFNMCFQQTVPAQRLALQYTREVNAEFSRPLYLCGHSKGGNLAVFAAARSSPMIQESIVAAYNNDGPGFSDYMMGDPGYLTMVSRIKSFVPQSSLIGMIMEHEEMYTIIKSNKVNFLQHDPFAWEVIGNHFQVTDELTDDSKLFSDTIRNWLSGMTNDERNQMVDMLFELLTTGGVDNATDIFQLKNLLMYWKTIGSNEKMRKILHGDFMGLLEALRIARNDQDIKRIE